MNTQTIGVIDIYFRHFKIERLYSLKHLYLVKLCESPRTTFTTAEQGRGKALYHILHSPSPTRHYEINASVTIKNILMWSRKQQNSDSKNMKTDCIKRDPTGNTNIAFTSYQQVAARRVQILATSALRVGKEQVPKTLVLFHHL